MRPTIISSSTPSRKLNCTRTEPQTGTAVWLRILQRVPGSVLWLYKHPRAAMYRLQEAARAKDPALVSRILFAPPCRCRAQSLGLRFRAEVARANESPLSVHFLCPALLVCIDSVSTGLNMHTHAHTRAHTHIHALSRSPLYPNPLCPLPCTRHAVQRWSI